MQLKLGELFINQFGLAVYIGQVGYVCIIGIVQGDAPSFVEMARAVVAIGVTKRL
jgi:hypothetical protein